MDCPSKIKRDAYHCAIDWCNPSQKYVRSGQGCEDCPPYYRQSENEESKNRGRYKTNMLKGKVQVVDLK